MIDQSRNHLESVGETYTQHFRFASTVGVMAIAAGLAGLIHAVIPALCTHTASRILGSLSRLLDRRDLIEEIRDDTLEASAFVALLGLATLVSLPLWLMDVPRALQIAYTVLAFSLPLALLLTNRELRSESASEQAT